MAGYEIGGRPNPDPHATMVGAFQSALAGPLSVEYLQDLLGTLDVDDLVALAEATAQLQQHATTEIGLRVKMLRAASPVLDGGAP